MRKHTQAHTQSSNIILLVFTVFLIVTGITLTVGDAKALSKLESFVHYNAPDTEIIMFCAQEEIVVNSEYEENGDEFVDTKDLKELRALMEECEANMIEEWADVDLSLRCALECNYFYEYRTKVEQIELKKLDRWLSRLEAKEQSDE